MHLSKNRKRITLPIKPVSRSDSTEPPNPTKTIQAQLASDPAAFSRRLPHQARPEGQSPKQFQTKPIPNLATRAYPVQQHRLKAKGAVASGTAALVDAGYRYTPEDCQHGF